MNSIASPAPVHRERAVLAVAGLAVFAVFLDTTILFVAFSSIGESFPGTSTSSLSWVLNALHDRVRRVPGPGGVLADRFGRRRVFLAAVAGFTLASALCGLAPTAGVLIAARDAAGRRRRRDDPGVAVARAAEHAPRAHPVGRRRLGRHRRRRRRARARRSARS